MNLPKWLKPVSLVLAVLVVALLVAGAVAVPYRATRPPSGADQPRVHYNTKNSTRFDGNDLATVAGLVGQAVYPATQPVNTPDVVILYNPSNWQAGLSAASLLRPLNAVLLPAVPEIEMELDRLQPGGSEPLGGVQLLLVDDAAQPESNFSSQQISAGDIGDLLAQTGVEPRHAILVDPTDPETALLAAPWAAYSGDLIVFDPADVPAGSPLYILGGLELEGDDIKRITAGTPAATSVAFARYEDEENPFFGWGMVSPSPTGYRAYTLARPDDPAMALLSANLARRGKPGPLLWANETELPAVVNDYLWSQRAAFWVTPSEGPFHHFYVLGDTAQISFPAQGQADYAVEIGPYVGKGAGASGIDMLATMWVVFGIASALWIAFHEQKFLPHQMWIMRLAWPMVALVIGPFGILLYYLAYRCPVIRRGEMWMWDRPLWLQGLVSTVGSVGFGGPLMVVIGFIITFFGMPLIANDVPYLFWLGTPMVLLMIANYIGAVTLAWLFFQTPMLAMFYGLPYAKTLPKALPIVLASMASVSLAMFPGMWWLMMMHIPMMPTEESILWFGVMFFTVFMGLLVAWPFNYMFIRAQRKAGLM